MFKLLSFKKNTTKSKTQFTIGIVILLLVIAGVIRFTQWFTPTKPPSLLTQAEGLIELSQINDIHQFVPTLVKEPTQTFNATLHIIGVYTTSQEFFPTGTVALVYVRDGYRFVEISTQPQTSVESILEQYALLPQESVALSKDLSGTLIRLRDSSYCRNPPENKNGLCQITRLFVFRLNDAVIQIAADGNHPSDGELIEIARSLITE